MIDIIKLIEDNKVLLKDLSNNNLLEEFFIKKYGTKKEAKEAFKSILVSSELKDNFEELLLKELGLDIILKVFNSFSQSSNYTETLQNLKQTSGDLKSTLSTDDVKSLNHNLNTLQSLSNNFEISVKQKDDIITQINQNVRFNLANTRKELGYPHPRTFNPWLNFFFDNKYKAKTKETGKNAGVISLFEYIDIVSAFILSYDEDKLDFSKPDEILKRLEFQKQTQKQFLINREGYYYSKLKEKLEDLNLTSIYKDKFEDKDFDISKRKIPYLILSIIKEDLKNRD